MSIPTAFNPRFVWNVGAIAEVHPDIPEQDDSLVLWDRQEQKPVATIHPDYAQAMCLERTYAAELCPFTNLENWFNRCENEALASEGIVATTPEFSAADPDPSLIATAVRELLEKWDAFDESGPCPLDDTMEKLRLIVSQI